MIVVCATCGQPMDGSSCTDDRAERWVGTPEEPIDWPCRDCGVQPGGYHHPGCCVALCQVCGDQLLACEGDHALVN